MAKTLTFTIADDQSGLLLVVPTAAVPRILAAFTAGLDPAPATQADKIQVTRQVLAGIIRGTVLNYEQQAAIIARQADPTDPLNTGLTQS